MKIGTSTHIDPGTVAGVLIAMIGALPEIISDPTVKEFLPSGGLAHALQIAGIVIAAVRGQMVRREQYRESEAKPSVVEEKDENRDG